MNIRIISLFLALATTALAGENGWISLFNGKDLSGWTQRGGTAKYTVKDGCIVGYTATNTPNSFLCTTNDYADFILEYDFLVEPALNSGVQIRSHDDGNRVYGYQIEIDNDTKKARYWTAGLYEEGRRAWLFPGKIGGNPKEFTKTGAATIKTNDWNHIKVEANGNRIRTWLNGVPRVDVRDDASASGFIGLQVHAHKEAGIIVKWRNIRIKPLAP